MSIKQLKISITNDLQYKKIVGIEMNRKEMRFIGIRTKSQAL